MIVLKDIRDYETREGRSPFREWMLGLKDRSARARIRNRIDRLRVGHSGDYRFLGGGVFELRFHFGPGYRLYYAEDGDSIVLLLCAGDKSSQSNDIERARANWEDYRRRQ